MPLSTNALSPVLLIAEAANPEWVSVPLIGWSLAQAISRKVPAHLVTQVRNRDALVRAGLVEGKNFTAIDSERLARPLYRVGGRLRGGDGVGWTTITAVSTLGYYYFEWLAWKRFGAAIQDGEYSAVHRITPVSPTTPSILAKRCARLSTPFILGPLNGGVPWPREFDSVRRQEREWLSYVRSAYKLLPAYRSTLRMAAAIIVGSRSTLNDVPARYRHKCVYVPENGIDPTQFKTVGASEPSGAVRACFVGRLVPYKGPDMLLEAIAPQLRNGDLLVDIIGDGPLAPDLRAFVQRHNLDSSVTFHGWVTHDKLQSIMTKSQILLFPSIREFGGGVVLESMALGIVPVVVDYAGPAELVTETAGYKIPLGTRGQIVDRLRSVVRSICNEPRQLRAKSISARERVQKLFTWDVKARQIIEVYAWARGTRPDKPEFFTLGSP